MLRLPFFLVKKLPRRLLALVDGVGGAGNAHGYTVHARKLLGPLLTRWRCLPLRHLGTFALIRCARLYSAMNNEIVVCCYCLLLSCSHVNEVQKCRSWTVKLTQKCRLESTTSCSTYVGSLLIARVAGEFKSLASTDKFKTVITHSLRVRASSILSNRTQRPRIHARSSAAPPPAPGVFSPGPLRSRTPSPMQGPLPTT
jgi:hypothetical protein